RMAPDEIERLLASGVRLAVRVPLDDPSYLGWIAVYKPRRRPSGPRHLYLVGGPYLVLVLELNREGHEGGGYETEEDYRRKDRHWFSTIEEVGAFLASRGFSLDELRDGRE